ncbi:undecaprenyldiphospho-muramoylpentapeptide beta-N-acetylglucosaminyltransferase [Corynebacterium pseudodiphtheriticum]|uniref:UDP-N-acetylglucosamine--N-acetylmuramyl-(pentapeptide) pyrophosphoryl-undecaprenol N-acetylglucosamine transferase n=1 Tax=Corynebacterium pseudodiphtheriticum TaxID=37637 RepID=A0ABT7FWJ1_9CORY|nr:undecaprenyldiphospho-muramoylpentapeptide beta-N-acetylglucosaminyltransferase [Corynebacterium pseudodiphtheriticum]MDK4290357.1 undecaprenyldiphospho-muramoylpentapeptide beta-N-acetylglucosaminyltransferase [Corynebacterium pseudodiphtheriticum]
MASTTDSALTIVLAGGGTAGHIEPALAVGEVLRNRYGAQVLALGTSRGLESDIIPARGFDLELITPVPVPRRLNADLFALPFKVVRSIRQARKILKKNRADAVFGTGGYVSASAYLAAKSLGIPFYVLETNALAGMANKMGVRLGGTGFNAIAGSGMPGDIVGVPVRPQLAGGDPNGEKTARAREIFGLVEDRPTILVTGGSQGAASINAAVAGSVDRLVDAGYQILHAYGKKNQPPHEHPHYVSLPYIEDMAAALAVADLVVCRSGAMTVAEVSASGLPAVYVPLPHGNGEQGLNCEAVVAEGAARKIDDAKFSPDTMYNEVSSILGDSGTYQRMCTAAAASQQGDAAWRLAERIIFDNSVNPSPFTSAEGTSHEASST